MYYKVAQHQKIMFKRHLSVIKLFVNIVNSHKMEKIAVRNKTVARLHFFYNASYIFLKLLVKKRKNKHLILAELAVKLPTKHGSFRGPKHQQQR